MDTARPPVMVEGTAPGHLEPLRQAFAEVFSTGNEVGAALSVVIGGEPVVSLWGGHADAARTRPWTAGTIVNIYSLGKPFSCLCVLRLVEEGRVELEQPVAHYWPEFAQAGKAAIPVRMLLTHQAGLPAVAKPLPPGIGRDWEAMCAALAEQEPWWEPGTAHGYHTNTQGFFVGEIVRRVTGLSMGAYFRDEIAGPAGIDFHWGFGPELDGRCAELLPMTRPPGEPAPAEVPLSELRGDELMRAATNRNPIDLTGRGISNTREWRSAEVPSTNGHASAAAVARFYGSLSMEGSIGPYRILGREMRDAAIVEQVYGEDRVLGRPTRYGLGFQLTMAERRLGPGARTFGHFGAGGSLGFADPDRAIGFGYVMNAGRPGWQHPHIRKLIDVLYACLGG